MKGLRKRHPTLVLTLVCSVLLGCGPADDEGPVPTDPEVLMELGQRKARMCLSCHGRDGIARVPSYPSIGGLSKDYLRSQLLEFRSGERQDPMMSSIARSLSDTEIAALSHYYASLPGPQARD